MLALAIALATATTASARCEPQAATCQASWLPTFGGFPGVEGSVKALKVFDDGSGPSLFVGGQFPSAGGVPASAIAKWDGASWSSLGSGVSMTSTGVLPEVRALAVFDDGSGPALFAGGDFKNAGGVLVNRIAKWNGSSWSSLITGVNQTVSALQVFDDGLGPRLFVGGSFTNASGLNGTYIAKWNGVAWSPVPGLGQPVSSLAKFDDGTGEALYAGTSSGVYKFLGTAWAPVGTGLGGRVNALEVFDAGTGPSLYAGGEFPVRAARWNGSSWVPLGGGVNGNVKALAVFNDGNSTALFVGGEVTQVGPISVAGIARWSGVAWSAVGTGVGGTGSIDIGALATYDDGHGNRLYAGGAFSTAGAISSNGIAKWDGISWSTLGRAGIDGLVSALTTYDGGSGPMLVAGGWFTTTGSVAANSIAKWSGTKWSTLGSGMGGATAWVMALAVYDDGTGPALYAAGLFNSAGGVAVNNIAKWDGTSWSALGSGLLGPIDSRVLALAVFDDGTGAALYAGGGFTYEGGQLASNIAKWNGTSWSAVGGGMNVSGWVRAMTVFDDGTGPALFAAGSMSSAGGVSVSNIAKWDGTNWTGLGSPMTATYYTPIIYALTTFDDGSGTALYACGVFGTVAGITVNNVAKWNGVAWSALGSGITGNPPPSYSTQVQALGVYDDANGSKLFAKGEFTTAGGIAAGSIAAWDGSSWSPLGQGLSLQSLAYGSALAVYDDSSGPALYVGGSFGSALDSGDSNLAKWGCAFTSIGSIYCTSSTTTNGCTPSLTATGSASASNGSGFTLSISNLESHRLGAVFYGIHGQLAAPWGAPGSSLLCVKAPLQRLHSYNSGGSPGLCNGLISEDWNLFVATHATALGQPFLGGETVWAQGWFRDPPAQKTTALSNALAFAVGP